MSRFEDDDEDFLENFDADSDDNIIEAFVDHSGAEALEAYLGSDFGAESFLSSPLDETAFWPRANDALETSPSTSTPLTLPAGFRKGVWVDVGGTNLDRNRNDHLSSLHALGIKDACIMINGHTHARFGFTSVSQAVLGRLVPLLAPSAIDLTLTSWLRPERRYIDDLLAALPAYAASVSARAIEFDVEEPWSRRRPVGFATHTEAADHLFAGLAATRAAGMRIEITCQVDLMTSAPMRRLLELADGVVPQAYSMYRPGRAHAPGGAYGPRGLQDRAVSRLAEALSASGSKDIIMGLAAYRRTGWPGQTPRSIMEMELRHSASLAAQRVHGVRYWSWKHIAGFDGKLGRPSNRYAHAFLTSVS